MKKMISFLLLIMLPGLLAALQTERPIAEKIAKNINSRLKKYVLLRNILFISAFLIFLGLAGSFFSMGKQPVVLNQDIYDLSETIESNSCNYSLLTFIGPFGEISPLAAAHKAQLKRIVLIDYYQINYIIVQKNCVRVYGIRN